MKTRIITYASILAAGLLATSCDNAVKTPELNSMRCEYVPDGGTAILYGKNLKSVKSVIFPGDLAATPQANSNDSVLYVTVPNGAKAGRITVSNGSEEVKSPFHFKDDRNIIVNFDSRVATWGGYEPFDEDGNKIKGIVEIADSVTPLPTQLPDPCDGNYGFLYGTYDVDWAMKHTMFLQYVANTDEGGRGKESVASLFQNEKLEDLVLKFEVFIPKATAYNGPRTEIFFGPYNAANKHGRELSAICFWKPFEGTKDGFHTDDSWMTVTIPLSEFHHGIESDDLDSKYPLDLTKATNFSFVQFGPKSANPIFMCVDNFRIVPAE